MKEIHWFYAPDVETSLELPADEARHAVRVLRMQVGDMLAVTDGLGHLFDASIVSATQKRCHLCLEERHDYASLWHGRVCIAVAPTKNIDRMEWLAEKATEIGWDALTFLDCCRSERRKVRIDRIENILISAMKQSRKCVLPQLQGMTSFRDFILQPFEGQKFIAHCYADSDISVASEELRTVVDSDSASLVMIGPEGDFSVEEVEEAIEHGFKPIRLGSSRLRTETAALVAVHTMHLAKTSKEN